MCFMVPQGRGKKEMINQTHQYHNGADAAGIRCSFWHCWSPTGNIRLENPYDQCRSSHHSQMQQKKNE